MSLDYDTARLNMIEQQIRPWEVLDPTVLDACAAVHRELFVPDDYRDLAFTDTTIEIGHGQVMMAPKVEARLLQALGVRPADRVLEIGTGSGYLTALLATLGAHVTSIEYFGDLSERASARLRAAGISNVKLHVGDGIGGWSAAEPYDVIVVTGSSPERLAAVERQLSIGGRLFIVLGSGPVMEAVLLRRVAEDTWTRESLFETEITPLIGAEPKPEFRF
ncbi:MAG: protein-L-isoaspartate O-methyltransferase family protein [Gammaproteobacteria bacterium]